MGTLSLLAPKAVLLTWISDFPGLGMEGKRKTLISSGREDLQGVSRGASSGEGKVTEKKWAVHFTNEFSFLFPKEHPTVNL